VSVVRRSVAARRCARGSGDVNDVGVGLPAEEVAVEPREQISPDGESPGNVTPSMLGAPLLRLARSYAARSASRARANHATRFHVFHLIVTDFRACSLICFNVDPSRRIARSRTCSNRE
jgi:hypothetical protein